MMLDFGDVWYDLTSRRDLMPEKHFRLSFIELDQENIVILFRKGLVINVIIELRHNDRTL